jgi:hypothetical protein
VRETRNAHKLLVGKLEGKKHLRGVIILKLILKTNGVRGYVWTGFNCLRIVTSGGLV